MLDCDSLFDQVTEYLTSHIWNQQDTVFYKRRDFAKTTSSSRNVSIEQILEAAKKTIAKDKKDMVQHNLCASRDDGTIFIGAGIQNIRIAHESPVVGSIYSPQPVVRLRAQGNVSTGYLTSFVNLSTGQHPADSSHFFNEFEKWLDFASTLGIYVPNMDIEIKRIDGTKRKGLWSETKGVVVKMRYNGTEFADGGILTFNKNDPSGKEKSAEQRTFFDFGAGLERLAWVMNNNIPFAEILFPKKICGAYDPVVLDSVRTLALLYGTDVLVNSTPEQKQKLRTIEANLVASFYKTNHYPILAHAHTYWSKFVNMQPFERVEQEFMRRLEKGHV